MVGREGYPADIVTLPAIAEVGGNDPGLREILMSLAPQYLTELEEAQHVDFDRPSVVGFESTAAFMAWREKNPRQETLVEATWSEKLGIRPTNNLHIWFLDSDMGGAYELNTAQTAGAKCLRRLQEADPEFFAACSLAARIKSVGDQLRVSAAGRARARFLPEDAQKAEEIAHVVDYWILALYMTEAVRRMSTDPAVDPASITALFR